jgi:hypothetical protein
VSPTQPTKVSILLTQNFMVFYAKKCYDLLNLKPIVFCIIIEVECIWSACNT